MTFKFMLGIVTPSFNSEKFIRETLQSVLSQKGDFGLFYHVQDGGSTDGTLDIVREFSKRVSDGEFAQVRPFTEFTWASEKDTGMYDAIARGFERVRGDVLAWLNSDDVYLAGALEKVASAFDRYPEVEWVKGITDYIDEFSAPTSEGKPYLYDRRWIEAGIYGLDAHFIQQDSVFWRRSLWDRSGGLNRKLRLAGDFELWTRFARDAELVTIAEPVSAFRKVPGQLSENTSRYEAEARANLSMKRVDPFMIQFLFRILGRLPNVFANFLYSLLGREKTRFITFIQGNPLLCDANAYVVNECEVGKRSLELPNK